jgi:hypothetical protein
MKGDFDDPFTHDDLTTARRQKWCKCSKCGKVQCCTPSTDFYGDFTLGSPLKCEGCMLNGTKIVSITEEKPRP